MNYISLSVIIFFCAVLIYAHIKGVKVTEAFSEGVSEGLATVKNIFPLLLMVLTAINMFKASGGMDVLVYLAQPLASFVGFPPEVLPVAILRPFSGSGSLAVLDRILAEYGTDGCTGRLASVICASTETTFYTFSVYLGGLSGRFGKILACSVVTDIFTLFFASLSIRLFP